MSTADNKRIAKNTLYLYIRMLLVMGVSLYTSRVVLEALGVEDYGVYNLVGGVVILFNFINNSMTACTQRYMCVAIGMKDEKYEQKVFSTSVVSHILISVLFILLAETIGLWFIKNVLQIPEGSETKALIVYQIAVITTIFNILRVPFSGAIIAYEQMSFFSYSSIVESLLKLLILLPLVLLHTNKLILYSALVAFTNFAILLWYLIYVQKCFPNCKTTLLNVSRNLIVEMIKFSGWSNFSSLSNLSAKQGLSFILNSFFGVAINAAVGIMNQVNNAVYGFITNFMTAVNPPIIKTFVAQEWDDLEKLFVNACKFSYYLMLVLSIPIIMNIDQILNIWLIDIPKYTNYFCAFSLLSLLPNVIGGPVWTIIQASGKIKKYQILISTIILINLPLDYLLLKVGVEPYMLLLVTMLINSIVVVIGIVFITQYTKISWKTITRKVVIPCMVVTVLALFITWIIPKTLNNNNQGASHLLLSLCADVLIVIFISFFFGLNRKEKRSLISIIRSKL